MSLIQTASACALTLLFAQPHTPLAEGSSAPAFKLRALDGTMVRLDELAYKGREKSWAKKRPVLIDFFRTDCGPCRQTMPELVQLSKDYKDRGLEVVLIALLEPEDGKAKLQRYLAEQKLPFTVVLDETEHFSKKYLGKQIVLPATFLLDREGVIRGVKHGAKGTLAEHFGPALAKVTAGAGG